MSFYTLLTAIGAADFINAQAGGTTVPFTHLALGDGNGAAVIPLESMTALVHEVHRVPISSVTADVENPSWLVIEAVVPTTVGGWTVRGIGLIGGGGAGNKLLAIGNFPDTYKPLLAEGSGRDLVVRMIVQVGNASVVQLTVDPSVAVATNQSIANAVAAHEAKADPHLILFIDEIHTMIGAGGRTGGLDAANLMKPALARGEIKCIGATTVDEYRKYIEKDPALERRFDKVDVPEPSREDAIQILSAHKVKNLDGIITRNVKDFSTSEITVFSPDQAINYITKKLKK